MRIAAIVNPAANEGRAEQRWPAVEAMVRARCDELTVRHTTGPGDAREFARSFASQEGERAYDMLISAGGDGTNHEVLHGMVDAGRANTLCLALLPLGTGGDFTRAFGTPQLAERVRRLFDGEDRMIDYGSSDFVDHQGQPETRPFLNIASVGLSAAVLEGMREGEKRRFGATGGYLIGAVRGISRWRNTQVICEMDGESKRIDLSLAAVGNGRAFGGGMWITPDAELDDGKFDILRAVGMSRPQLLATLAKVFRAAHRRVKGIHIDRAQTARLEPVDKKRNVPLELDGEQVGRLPASFSVVSRGLKLRVPSKSPRDLFGG